MADYQTSYLDDYVEGAQGMIANSEPYNHISRTNTGVVNFGQPVYEGAANHKVVPGTTFAATGAGSARAGNIGTGTITASPAITAGALSGRYTATLLSTSATAPYQVFDPNGNLVGTGVVGTANTTIPGITTFTILNAGTMTAGDTYYIDVTYTANDEFVGLSIRDPSVPALAATPDQYPDGYTISIMDFGVMWVTCNGAVVRGKPVYWNPATGLYTAATGILIPNAEFYESKTTTLVRVKLRKVS